MTKKSTRIADYFVLKAYRNMLSGDPFSAKKIHSLLYYAYVWELVLNKKHLFTEEIEVYEWGVRVVSEEAHLLEIESKIKDDTNASIEKDAFYSVKFIPDQTIELLDKIWNYYGKHIESYLCSKIRNEEPFQKAIFTDNLIKDKDILNFYIPEDAKHIFEEDVEIEEDVKRGNL